MHDNTAVPRPGRKRVTSAPHGLTRKNMTDWYPKRRFGDLPQEMARKFANREALVFQDERYTFAELKAEIDRAAKALMALGVERGDHVSLWLNNRSEWVFLMYALATVGAVQVPVNTRFRTNDLEYVLRQSDTAMLITHDTSGPIDYLDMVRQVVDLPAEGDAVADASFPELDRVVIVGAGEYPGTASWSVALSQAATVSDADLAARADAVDPDDPVFMMYTSGTTGFPKGVLHDHRLIRNVEERAFRMAVTENDTIMSYLPLFHAFGYSEAAMMSMATGARQILTETFDADEALDLIERERATIAHGFEAHMQMLCDAQQANPRDLSSLRTGVFAAGMHSATPVARRGERVMAPLKALSAYGMTEVWVGAALSALDDDPPHRLETSGYPAPGYEFKVVDPETGEQLSGRRARRTARQELRLDEGLLQEAQGDGGVLRRRRLVPHRRHGRTPRRRLHPLPRPFQGHAEGRRRERRPDGGGGSLARTPRRAAGRRGRPAGPPAIGSPGGVRRAETRGRHRGGRRSGLLPGQGRELQDSPPRDLHRRVSDDRIGQDSEGGATGRGETAVNAVNRPWRPGLSGTPDLVDRCAPRQPGPMIGRLRR